MQIVPVTNLQQTKLPNIMQRITEKQLQIRIDYLNKITGNPLTPWTHKDGRNSANVGNYHISGAYGGVCVNQMHNESGGVTCPLGSYHRPKRELMDSLNAFIAGIELKVTQNAPADFENAGYSKADAAKLAADKATNWKAANGGKRN